ncbi:MAG TPA: anti-sigma factor [Candidatus Binatia bacterium]|nr:anti-sigma factor [Candidatus Binatia bacterium]
MTDELRPMDHAAVDELGAAYALDALEPDEARAVRDHLATCTQPHAELRALIGADQVLAVSLEPVEPSPALRERVMTSIARAAQERDSAARPPAAAEPRQRGGWLDWLSPRVARPLAVAAVVALVAVGAWGVTLQSQLAERDRALRAVADAIAEGETAFRVEGTAGRGYVVDTPGSGAALLVSDLAALPADRIYELWLLDAAGTPVAVGTFTPADGEVAVVELERDLAGFTTFAVTVEASRVDAPTGDIVMAAPLAPT